MPIKVKEIVVGTEPVDISVSGSTTTVKSKEHIAEFIREAYSPYINEETGTWFEYDTKLKKFIDTGVSPSGPKGEDGKDYVITEKDYDAIADIIEPKVKPFWGGIGGNIDDQSDLKDELDKKLDTVSIVSNLEIDDLFK